MCFSLNWCGKVKIEKKNIKVSLTHFCAHRFSVLMIERLSMSPLFGIGLGTLSAMWTLRSVAAASRSVITIKEIQHKVYILAHDNFGFDEFPKHYLEQFDNSFTFHRRPVWTWKRFWCNWTRKKVFLLPNMENDERQLQK